MWKEVTNHAKNAPPINKKIDYAIYLVRLQQDRNGSSEEGSGKGRDQREIKQLRRSRNTEDSAEGSHPKWFPTTRRNDVALNTLMDGGKGMKGGDGDSALSRHGDAWFRDESNDG